MLKLLNDFLVASRSCVDSLLCEVESENEVRQDVLFSVMHKGKRSEKKFDGSHFFLRTSTEYSSPQLTLEEVQGIIATRLLETCSNYLEENKDRNLEQKDLLEISEKLRKPPSGRIIPFILNVDDTEPDRYSNNPFRDSIVVSGQSAFPVATVKTSNLKIDPEFVSKYRGSLISSEEVDFIKYHQQDFERYMDLVEFVKYDALEKLSEILGIDLCLPYMRMPLEILAKENCGDPLHLMIQGSHKDYETIATIYKLMGRSMKKKRTLLTVPRSIKGYGSKRSARGKLVFDGSKLKCVNVRYRNTLLYPNMADPKDLSLAKVGEDEYISVEAEDLTNYDYLKTPSSPQFSLYAIHSPERASLQHGVGAYAGSKLLKSSWSIYKAFAENLILQEVPRVNVNKVPLVLNLVPNKMWLHPKHKNLDTSIGCISNHLSLLEKGMSVENISFETSS